MEALQNLKYMFQKRDYMCKLDLKDSYFSVPLEKVKAIYSLPLVRKLARVPLPLLWFGTSTTNICKIVTNANDNLTQDKNQNYNLLSRRAIDWSHFRRDTHEPRHSNLPSETSGICHKLDKVCMTPVQEIEFLDLITNSVTLELSLKKTKILKVVSECQNLLNNPQTSILELTSLIGLLTSIIQAVLPARLNWHFLQMQQMSSLFENLSYLDKIVLNENSKIELNLWVQNLELCNGRALIQPPAELLIQTDASTKGWRGETCNGVSTGRMWSAHKMKNDLNVLELLAIKLAKRS